MPIFNLPKNTTLKIRRYFLTSLLLPVSPSESPFGTVYPSPGRFVHPYYCRRCRHLPKENRLGRETHRPLRPPPGEYVRRCLADLSETDQQRDGRKVTDVGSSDDIDEPSEAWFGGCRSRSDDVTSAGDRGTRERR